MLGTLASTYRPIFVVPTSSDRPQSHPSTSNHPIFTKLHPNHLQHPFYPLTSKNPAFLPSVGVFLRSLRVSVVLWLCRPRSTLQNRRIRSNNRFIDDFCDLGALQSPYCSLVNFGHISTDSPPFSTCFAWSGPPRRLRHRRPTRLSIRAAVSPLRLILR